MQHPLGCTARHENPIKRIALNLRAVALCGHGAHSRPAACAAAPACSAAGISLLCGDGGGVAITDACALALCELLQSQDVLAAEVIHNAGHLIPLKLQGAQHRCCQLQGGLQRLRHHRGCSGLLKVHGMVQVMCADVRLDLGEVLVHGVHCAVVCTGGVHGDDGARCTLGTQQVQHGRAACISEVHRQVLCPACSHAVCLHVNGHEGDQVLR
mmetsp:Transcript_27210/g.59450  ORF Transcript_27210/g.59450 Transcript_27210/m.59450 type:complete len:212 (-) Transcript_27210:5885-6520(-)